VRVCVVTLDFDPGSWLFPFFQEHVTVTFKKGWISTLGAWRELLGESFPWGMNLLVPYVERCVII
jgi:hypothetical protein